MLENFPFQKLIIYFAIDMAAKNKGHIYKVQNWTLCTLRMTKVDCKEGIKLEFMEINGFADLKLSK